MHNAFAARPVTLYQVWGGPELPPSWTLPSGTKIFVCYSPTLRQWVASVTTLDYRYDALVGTEYFVLDASLLPVETKLDGPSYYLQKIRSK